MAFGNSLSASPTLYRHSCPVLRLAHEKPLIYPTGGGFFWGGVLIFLSLNLCLHGVSQCWVTVHSKVMCAPFSTQHSRLPKWRVSLGVVCPGKFHPTAGWLADSCSETVCACLSSLAEHVTFPLSVWLWVLLFYWQFVKCNACKFSPVAFEIEASSC